MPFSFQTRKTRRQSCTYLYLCYGKTRLKKDHCSFVSFIRSEGSQYIRGNLCLSPIPNPNTSYKQIYLNLLIIPASQGPQGPQASQYDQGDQGDQVDQDDQDDQDDQGDQSDQGDEDDQGDQDY